MTHNITILRNVLAINNNLAEAIRCYEIFEPTGRNKNLIGRVNKGKVSPGYNVISTSLHKCILTALCRIWDKSKGTANMYGLVSKLEKAVNSDASCINTKQLSSIRAKADKIERSLELAAIRRLRHNAIAHTSDPNECYKGKARGAVYGDEFSVIKSTISLLEEINRVTNHNPQYSLHDLQTLWKQQAGIFWNVLLFAKF